VLSTYPTKTSSAPPPLFTRKYFLMFDFLFPSRKKIAALEVQINLLQAELVQARMKNASYRGKIGSLSRKLKDSTK